MRSDITRPRQVGQVQTCRGSHTHSVVDSNDRRVIVYVSGTAGVRDEKELAGCVGNIAGDPRTALFSIDVVEIPVADPSKARVELGWEPKTTFEELARLMVDADLQRLRTARSPAATPEAADSVDRTAFGDAVETQPAS